MLGAPRSRSAHARRGASGVLEHGFARIRCAACAHEYLLAFSCKCRYFCPSGHAKRLALWMPWLDRTLLAPVPHRQVVLTIPKRLNPCASRWSMPAFFRLAAEKKKLTDGSRCLKSKPESTRYFRAVFFRLSR